MESWNSWTYCLKKINKDFVFIDEFLMSCRAIDIS